MVKQHWTDGFGAGVAMGGFLLGFIISAFLFSFSISIDFGDGMGLSFDSATTITIVLAALSIMITVLGIMVACIAAFGFGYLKQESYKAGNDHITAALADDGELRKIIIDRVDAITAKTQASGTLSGQIPNPESEYGE